MGHLRATLHRSIANAVPFGFPWPTAALIVWFAITVATTCSGQAQENASAATSEGSPATAADTPPVEMPAATLAAGAVASEEYGKVLFEPHIREILSAHCVDCHGLKQSKGGFRVDERDSLLGYITPGDLQGSSLWTDYLITQDEDLHMPPLKNGHPLSQFELAAIRVWIEDGAVWPEGLAWSAGQGGETVAEPQPIMSAEKNVVQKAMLFTGFFHPAIVHFPIGLLFVSGFFAILAFLKRDAFEAAAFHCLWIGALGAIASCIAGWAYADLQGYADSNAAVFRHRVCGIAVAVISVALTPIALAARKSQTSSWRYVWAGGALCLALLVGIAGHQGGELTYGEDLVGRAYQKAFGK